MFRFLFNSMRITGKLSVLLLLALASPCRFLPAQRRTRKPQPPPKQ